MITIGGMLATDDEEASLRRCDFLRMPFVRRARSDDFYRIRVPRLTRKERMFLDRDMPATPGWKPKAFELSAEDIAAYQEIYRYYPIYGELLF
jgi:hypothetical protein